MSQPSTLKVFSLFARLAFRRFNNRTQMLARKAKPASSPESHRVASLPTSRSTSLERWFPRVFGLLMLSGLGMFATVITFTLTGIVRVDEMSSAERIRLEPEHYRGLQEAAAISDESARTAELDKVFQQALDNVPSEWAVRSGKRIALDRFQARGLDGFQSVEPERPWRGSLAMLAPEGRQRALRAVGCCLLLVNLALACSSLAMRNRSLSRTDPELLWLFQFPVSRPVLFVARLTEHLFGNLGCTASIIVSWVLLAGCGYGFASGLLLGVLLGVAAALGSAALCLIAEVWLMQYCGRKVRGTIIGTASVIGGLGALYGMLFSNARITTWPVFFVADHLPAWCLWNPFSLGWGASGGQVMLPTGWWLAAPLTALAMAAGAVTLVSRMTARGLEGGLESARRASKTTSGGGSTSWFRGLAWKELLQVRRQPEFLFQVLSAPVLIGFLLYLQNPERSISLVLQSPATIFAAILSGSCYLLLVAGSGVLRNELGTLWLLQCQPRSLADCIRTKARVWGTIAALVAASVSFGAVACGGISLLDLFPRIYFLLAMVWLFAEVLFGQLALGATIGSDHRVQFRKMSYFFPGFLSYSAAVAVYGGNWWVMLGTLAIGWVASLTIRERAVAELPWLTEPIERPAPRIYAVQGLVALLVFLNLQALFAGMLAPTGWDSAAINASTYLVAAVLVGWRAFLKFVRLEPPALPAANAWRTWQTIAIGWSATCIVAAIWVFVVASLGFRGDTISRPRLSLELSSIPPSAWLSVAMAVIAAPLFEELVVRGLLYRCLRRTWNASASIAMTSVLFTVIHPVTGVVAILTLGIATAWAVERTQKLWPSILIHMGYNAFVMVLWAIAGSSA